MEEWPLEPWENYWDDFRIVLRNMATRYARDIAYASRIDTALSREHNNDEYERSRIAEAAE